MKVDKKQVDQIKQMIKKRWDVDLSRYKDEFFSRCITKCTFGKHIKKVDDYIKILSENEFEKERFCEALSIYHTQFMRDVVKYEVFRDYVLPEIMAKNRMRVQQAGKLIGTGSDTKSGKAKIRIWSAGCAGGEEPYSIAMMMYEILGDTISRWEIEIISTDVNMKLLKKAEQGMYENVELDKKGLSKYFLDKYFVRIDDGYTQIKPEIRKLVKFEKHNLFNDRFMNGFDVIFCRNVLIYVDHNSSYEALKKFHTSLNRGGYIFLGNSEVMDERLFCSYKKIKIRGEFIYRKIEEGSSEYQMMEEKLKNIKAGLGM